MIFLQGAARPNGPAAALLRLAESGHLELCISDEILVEIRDVLSRREIGRKFPSLTAELVDVFVDTLRRQAVFVSDVPRRLTLPRDPKDEKYVNLAIVASADYLVSRDNDLLDLMKPDNSLHETIQSMAPQLSIIDPVALLQQLRSME